MIPPSRKNQDSTARKAIAWALAMIAASLMGTWAWLTTIFLFIAGAGIIHGLGLDVPGWVGWLALLGMPLGAWVEIRFGWARSPLDF